MHEPLSVSQERPLRALTGALAALIVFVVAGLATGLAVVCLGDILLGAAEAGRMAPELAGLGVGLLCAFPGALALAAELAGRVHDGLLGIPLARGRAPFGRARGSRAGRRLLPLLLVAPVLLPALLVVRASAPGAALALGLGAGVGLTLAARLQARALRGQWSESGCFTALLGVSAIGGFLRPETLHTIYPLAGAVYTAWALGREACAIRRGLRTARAPGPDLEALAAEVRALVRLRRAVATVWIGGGLLAWIGLLIGALVVWGSPLRAGLLAAGCGVLGALLVAWPVERAGAGCRRRAHARLDARFPREHLDRRDAQARVQRILDGGR